MLYAPPRHGKSRLTAVEFAAWLLGRDPSRKIILASYSSDLAVRHAKQVRETIESGDYQALFPSTKTSPNDRAAEFWTTTAGGYLKAVGVGGSLTGHGADFLLIDDPFKDHEEAHSPTIREKVWNWFLSTAYTRLSPGGRIVIINTRWNMDDLCGRILDPKRRNEIEDSEEWVEINYPAICDCKETDPLKREVDSPLCPELFTLARLKAIKATIGPYLWAALYQGRPVPSEGHRINPNWFEIVQPDEVPEGLSWERYWDLACTKKQTSDSTAGVAGAMDETGYLYLRDMVAGQWDWPSARQRIVNTALAEPGIPLGVEAVAGFVAAYQNLREVMPKTTFLSQYDADKDKHARALPWIALASNGKVRLVAGSWVTEFLNQAAEFPLGAHDDMVDAVSGVYQMLAGNQSGSFSGDSINDVLLGHDRDWVSGDHPTVIEEVTYA